ncbi:hypothetical protein IE077_001107, partial [Cardiosporidium cionae]
MLRLPQDIYFDEIGYGFIADTSNNRIIVVSPDGFAKPLTSSNGTEIFFDFPTTIFSAYYNNRLYIIVSLFDDNRLYGISYFTQEIILLAGTGINEITAGGDMYPAEESSISSPNGVQALYRNTSAEFRAIEILIVAGFASNFAHEIHVGLQSPRSCPRGAYTPIEGSRTEKDCQACPAGYFCNELFLPVPSGRCKAGYYCEGGTKYPLKECPAGNFCPHLTNLTDQLFLATNFSLLSPLASQNITLMTEIESFSNYIMHFEFELQNFATAQRILIEVSQLPEIPFAL